MNYKVKYHFNIEKENWQSFVDKNAQSTVFHTPYMHEVYENTPDLTPFAIFILDADNQIQAMLSGCINQNQMGVMTCLTRRAILYQSPIFNSIESLSVLLKEYLIFIKGKAIYSEIRNHYDLSNHKQLFLDMGFTFQEHLDIIVNLNQSEERLWDQVHSKRRNQIRKAIKEQIVCKPVFEEHLEQAYHILSEVYTRVKLPLLPIKFFRSGLQFSESTCGMMIFGAFLADELIGVMIVLYYKDRLYDLYAGSLQEYYVKNANDLIPWELFRWAIAHGYSSFDFGGAGKPDVPYGVRDYKLQFGGELVNFGRFTCVHAPLKMKIAEKGFKIWQYMKGKK